MCLLGEGCVELWLTGCIWDCKWYWINVLIEIHGLQTCYQEVCIWYFNIAITHFYCDYLFSWKQFWWTLLTARYLDYLFLEGQHASVTAQLFIAVPQTLFIHLLYEGGVAAKIFISQPEQIKQHRQQTPVRSINWLLAHLTSY